jgi:hypothetical protein
MRLHQIAGTALAVPVSSLSLFGSWRLRHTMRPHRSCIAPPPVRFTLTALALPRIQSEQHHQTIHDSPTLYAPEAPVSAVGTGVHFHLYIAIISPLENAQMNGLRTMVYTLRSRARNPVSLRTLRCIEP